MIATARRLAERLCVLLGDPPEFYQSPGGPIVADTDSTPTTDATPVTPPADTVKSRHAAFLAAHAQSVAADKATADAQSHLVAALRLIGHPVVMRADDGSFQVLALAGTNFVATPASDADTVVPASSAASA